MWYEEGNRETIPLFQTIVVPQQGSNSHQGWAPINATCEIVGRSAEWPEAQKCLREDPQVATLRDVDIFLILDNHTKDAIPICNSTKSDPFIDIPVAERLLQETPKFSLRQILPIPVQLGAGHNTALQVARNLFARYESGLSNSAPVVSILHSLLYLSGAFLGTGRYRSSRTSKAEPTSSTLR